MNNSISEVWSITISVSDCHESLVGLYASREIAEGWLAYYIERGAQSFEIVGPHIIRFGAPS